MRFPRVFASVLLAVFAWGLLCLPVGVLAQEFPGEIQFAEEDAAAAAGVGCACIVGIVVFVIVWLAIFIAIAVYVYRDAQARGMENAVLWLILVILTGLIGLIVYLIVRPPKPEQGPPTS